MSYVKANVLNSTTLFSLLCDDHKDKKAVVVVVVFICLFLMNILIYKCSGGNS